MNQSVDLRMLDALEIFHYSYRFQNRLFILVLEKQVNLQNIITDLRVLYSAHIQIIVICHDHDKLINLLQVWNNRGCPFQHVPKVNDAGPTEADAAFIEKILLKGNIPVLNLATVAQSDPDSTNGDHFAMNLASFLSVDKVFFLSAEPGLIIDDQFLSHTTSEELIQYLSPAHEINIGQQRLQYLVEENLRQGFDIVLLEGKSGCLFQEIFTHRGIGTLLTSSYPNTIRKAGLSDVMDIALLMKPYVQSSIILPVAEDDLARDIANYYVYTVNNSIVAAAKLTTYDESAEMAKFCTLPRYQGKGRAHELAERLIETAKTVGKKSIFSLSIDPRMFDFFQNLGFSECDRHDLPEDWRKNYDLSRPSKAFRLIIPTSSRS
ncbi:MAG: GNAT family N-acetyltransferase [Deltaproteobacteria bacterium]|nr:GNAT family N-acetyltransferase [Deltaproteobacteria bacterium]